MAHGDYNCCAVCDNKLDYNAYDARTKEEICPSCLKELRDLGLNILDVTELINWLKTADEKDIQRFTKKTSYSKCFYGNEIDELIEQRAKNSP